MRLTVIAVLSSMVLAAPVLAQDQPAAPDPDRIVFDIKQNATDSAAWDFGNSRTFQQAASPPPACLADSDIIQAQAAGPQRYDDNGAPIRAPAACTLDRPRTTVAQTAITTELLREPACEGSATGYACASSGAVGNATYEREARCRETATSRICSSSFSIGNSEEGRNLANELLDELRDD